MNEELAAKPSLSLKWIYLAWVGMAFTSGVIAAISSVVHGAPEPVVRAWGIGNFTTFAIALYSIGTALAVCILYLHLRARGLDLRATGLTGSLTPRGVGYALLGLTIAFLIYPTVEAALKPFGVGMFWKQGASSYLRSSTSVDLALTVLTAVFIGPIAEEIVFRGYLLNAFVQRKMKVLIACLLSALVFTSAHAFVGPGTMVFIFFWSFIPSFLLLKFGNLYPAILFHVLNNFVAYVVFPLWVLE